MSRSTPSPANAGLTKASDLRMRYPAAATTSLSAAAAGDASKAADRPETKTAAQASRTRLAERGLR